MAIFTGQTALDIYRLFAVLARNSQIAGGFQMRGLRVRDATSVLVNQFHRKGGAGRDWLALASWLGLLTGRRRSRSTEKQAGGPAGGWVDADLSGNDVRDEGLGDLGNASEGQIAEYSEWEASASGRHVWLRSLVDQRPELHTLVPSIDRELQAKRVTCHALGVPLPRGSIVRLVLDARTFDFSHAIWPPARLRQDGKSTYDIYLTSPELTFFLLASQCDEGLEDLARLVAVGFELCGHYVSRPKTILKEAPTAPKILRQPGFEMMERPLTTTGSIVRYLESLRLAASKGSASDTENRTIDGNSEKVPDRRPCGLRGIRIAERAAKLIVGHAGSPMETRVAMLLCLPRVHGGFGIPKPELNGLFLLSKRAQVLADKHRLYADILWRDRTGSRVASIEYNSDAFHVNGARRDVILSDMHRGNAVGDMGVFGLDLTRDQLMDPDAFSSVAASVRQKLVRAGLCSRLKPDTAAMLRKREVLRVQLLGWSSVSAAAAARVRRWISGDSASNIPLVRGTDLPGDVRRPMF